MWYLIFCVTFFCAVFWPAVSWMLWMLGMAGSWRQAQWMGFGVMGALWLVGVIDLVRRKVLGLPLEPTAADGE